MSDSSARDFPLEALARDLFEEARNYRREKLEMIAWRIADQAIAPVTA